MLRCVIHGVPGCRYAQAPFVITTRRLHIDPVRQGRRSLIGRKFQEYDFRTSVSSVIAGFSLSSNTRIRVDHSNVVLMRKPTQVSRSIGAFRYRVSIRQKAAASMQPPPRMTRYAPAADTHQSQVLPPTSHNSLLGSVDAQSSCWSAGTKRLTEVRHRVIDAAVRCRKSPCAVSTPCCCRPLPLGWQAAANPSRERGRFKPVHAGNRRIVLAKRCPPPCRRLRITGRVDKAAVLSVCYGLYCDKCSFLGRRQTSKSKL